MWMKNNKSFCGTLVCDGKQIFNPSEEQIKAAGYEWVEPSVPFVKKKYSTLKIIRALDQQWPQYRTKLQAANILDQFFVAI